MSWFHRIRAFIIQLLDARLQARYDTARFRREMLIAAAAARRRRD